jgi:hypothetical protein
VVLEIGLRKARRAHAVRDGMKEVYIRGVLKSKPDIVLREDVIHVRKTQDHLIYRELEPMRQMHQLGI